MEAVEAVALFQPFLVQVFTTLVVVEVLPLRYRKLLLVVLLE
jgi:hypothetical protein